MDVYETGDGKTCDYDFGQFSQEVSKVFLKLQYLKPVDW